MTMSSSSPTLTGPKGYVHAREEADNRNNNNNPSSSSSSSSSSLFVRTVENRPYAPLLKVDPSDEATVIEIANVMFSCYSRDSSSPKTAEDGESESKSNKPKVTVITGGLTNALFKVDLPATATTENISVLVRVFGAEGLIDRDLETAYYARLCNNNNNNNGSSSSILHSRLDLIGRFGNGRVESWIPDMRQAHHSKDFQKEGLALEVARQMARLHNADVTVGENQNQQQEEEPTLWKVIESWIDELCQHLSHDKFREDDVLLGIFLRAMALQDGKEASQNDVTVTNVKQALSNQLAWLKNEVETRFPNAPVVFCHNDVNAGNILLNTRIIDINGIDDNENENGKNENELYNKESVCIIDYEYGSVNYAMYDVANFLCEHCGGNDNGVPDYDLLPSSERLTKFLEEYVRERNNEIPSKDAEKMTTVSELHAQVELFQMASNLYWGIWGILQAAGEVVGAEGTDTFKREDALRRLMGEVDLDSWDNLRYGKNRLERFRVCKKEEVSS